MNLNEFKNYLSSLRAANATDAPASASFLAIAAPIPLEAPVTIATLLPSNLFSERDEKGSEGQKAFFKHQPLLY